MKPHHDAETGQITGDSLVVCPSCGWVNLFRVAHIPERYLVPGSNPPRMKDFDVTMLLDLYPHTMARRYAKKFAGQRQKGMGLIFHGANGSGKTFLASMVAMKVVMQGYSVRFATFGQILRELHESYNAKQEVLSPLVRYQRCDLLVLDDLGAEQITAHSVAQLFILLNERMNGLKPTVVTTNLRPEEMGDALASDPVQGRRLADRLTGLSYPLEVRTNTSVRYIERDRALEELMGDDQ